MAKPTAVGSPQVPVPPVAVPSGTVEISFVPPGGVKEKSNNLFQGFIEARLGESVHQIIIQDDFLPGQPYDVSRAKLTADILAGAHFKSKWFLINARAGAGVLWGEREQLFPPLMPTQENPNPGKSLPVTSTLLSGYVRGILGGGVYLKPRHAEQKFNASIGPLVGVDYHFGQSSLTAKYFQLLFGAEIAVNPSPKVEGGFNLLFTAPLSNGEDAPEVKRPYPSIQLLGFLRWLLGTGK